MLEGGELDDGFEGLAQGLVARAGGPRGQAGEGGVEVEIGEVDEAHGSPSMMKVGVNPWRRASRHQMSWRTIGGARRRWTSV